MGRIFVTGIGTGIGKTIVSAILTEALQADYWKPIQAGLQDSTDSQTIKELVSNPLTKIHSEAFRLAMPASPHAAARAENIEIKIREINIPETKNNLVIEGAGGLMVPLNNNELMLDFMQATNAIVVLVVKHYLGSINHTLLSIEALKQRKIKFAGLIYNGDAHPSSEEAIETFTHCKVLGRIGQEIAFNKTVVLKYAEQFASLKKLLQ